MSDPLAPFRARFIARTRDELPVLRQAREASAPSAEFATIIHRMSGLAGTVGYGEISRLAAEVDDALQTEQPTPAATLDALIAALEALPPAF
jgi:HPt (histidine-containing phosphotransfer) domain-containing protein